MKSKLAIYANVNEEKTHVDFRRKLENQNKDMSRDSVIIIIFFIVNCGYVYFWEGETSVTKKKKEVSDISEEFLVLHVYISHIHA